MDNITTLLIGFGIGLIAGLALSPYRGRRDHGNHERREIMKKLDKIIKDIKTTV